MKILNIENDKKKFIIYDVYVPYYITHNTIDNKKFNLEYEIDYSLTGRPQCFIKDIYNTTDGRYLGEPFEFYNKNKEMLLEQIKTKVILIIDYNKDIDLLINTYFNNRDEIFNLFNIYTGFKDNKYSKNGIADLRSYYWKIKSNYLFIGKEKNELKKIDLKNRYLPIIKIKNIVLFPLDNEVFAPYECLQCGFFDMKKDLNKWEDKNIIYMDE